MKKFKRFVIGGIENKIFNLVAITVVLILAIYTVALGIQSSKLTDLVKASNEEQIQTMSGISDSTMDAVLNNDQSRITELDAMIADNYFKDAKSMVVMMADYAAKLYDSGNERRIILPTPDKCDNGVPCAQLIYDEDTDINDPAIVDEAGLLGNIGDMLVSVYDRSVLDACYVSTETGITVFADSRPGIKISDDGGVIAYPARQRPWYIGAKQKRDVYFTDILPDKYTGEYGVVCSCPVYDDDGRLRAVVGADLFVDSMIMYVNESEKDGTYLFVVNENGHVIMSPKSEGILEVKPESDASDLRDEKNGELATLVSDALNASTGVRQVEMDGITYYMCGAPAKTVGWAVITVVSSETVGEPTRLLQENYRNIATESAAQYNRNIEKARTSLLIILGIVVLLAIINANILSKRIVRPLNMMSQKVSEIQGDDLDFAKDKIYETGDEIELLADAFLGLTNRTKSYINEITRITAEKERIGAELNVATKIQADMLPRIFPPFPERKEFELYATMNPAKEVGGDFYDFFLVDDDHLALVMADVSGKGVPAALFMVIAKTLIKNHTMMGLSPSEVLMKVNEQLCEGNEAEYFVTVWLAVIEISTGKGIAANAGHEHPILKHLSGSYETVEYKHSPAVATIEGLKFKEHEFVLNKGDVLFVYTDGVPEATNLDGELFGIGRLLEILNNTPDDGCETILNAVKDGIDAFIEGEEQFDDITMLALRYDGS